MRGRSWHDRPGCPPFDDLRLLTIPFVDFQGRSQQGELVVATQAAAPLLEAFAALHAQRFPIERMRRIDHYDGDDDASMADNNCSAFNFRTIAGSETLSHHALGIAVDINPRLNPMLLDGKVYPANAQNYVARTPLRPGMIERPGAVVDVFDSVGWYWGGDWADLRDYHHFSQRPR